MRDTLVASQMRRGCCRQVSWPEETLTLASQALFFLHRRDESLSCLRSSLARWPLLRGTRMRWRNQPIRGRHECGLRTTESAPRCVPALTGNPLQPLTGCPLMQLRFLPGRLRFPAGPAVPRCGVSQAAAGAQVRAELSCSCLRARRELPGRRAGPRSSAWQSRGSPLRPAATRPSRRPWPPHAGTASPRRAATCRRARCCRCCVGAAASLKLLG